MSLNSTRREVLVGVAAVVSAVAQATADAYSLAGAEDSRTSEAAARSGSAFQATLDVELKLEAYLGRRGGGCLHGD
jgi:hypothetical protein